MSKSLSTFYIYSYWCCTRRLKRLILNMKWITFCISNINVTDKAIINLQIVSTVRVNTQEFHHKKLVLLFACNFPWGFGTLHASLTTLRRCAMYIVHIYRKLVNDNSYGQLDAIVFALIFQHNVQFVNYVWISWPLKGTLTFHAANEELHQSGSERTACIVDAQGNKNNGTWFVFSRTISFLNLSKT